MQRRKFTTLHLLTIAVLAGFILSPNQAYAWLCQTPPFTPKVNPYKCGVQGCGWKAFLFQNGNRNWPLAWSIVYQCDRFTACTVTANCAAHRVSPTPLPYGKWRFDGWYGSMSGYTNCCTRLWGGSGNWQVIR